MNQGEQQQQQITCVIWQTIIIKLKNLRSVVRKTRVTTYSFITDGLEAVEIHQRRLIQAAGVDGSCKEADIVTLHSF